MLVLLKLSCKKSLNIHTNPKKTGNFKFNRRKLIIRSVDVSHEGNIICVAKLDKYRAIASEPFRLQIASKFLNFRLRKILVTFWGLYFQILDDPMG